MKKAMHIVVALTLVAIVTLAAAAGAVTPQKVTIVMRDFSYTPAKVTLQAGVPAELTLVNKGQVAHEWMVYGMPTSTSMTMDHEWVEGHNYFHMVPVTTTGGKVTRNSADFVELKVMPGTAATLKFTPLKKGTFEMGCMIPGHYEAGQRGIVVVK